jgi:hypothetical protein
MSVRFPDPKTRRSHSLCALKRHLHAARALGVAIGRGPGEIQLWRLKDATADVYVPVCFGLKQAQDSSQLRMERSGTNCNIAHILLT